MTDATPEMPMGLAINFWDAIDDATSRAGLGAIRSGCKGGWGLVAADAQPLSHAIAFSSPNPPSAAMFVPL